MSKVLIGIDPTKTFLSTEIPGFQLGDVSGYNDPVNGYQEFVFGQAEAAVVAAGLVLVEGANNVWSRITTANTAAGQVGGHGSRVGACPAALTASGFGWFQVYGRGTINTLASAALGTRLNTTATAGALDDDGTAASRAIAGLVLKVATGGAQANNTSAVFAYPNVSVTL